MAEGIVRYQRDGAVATLTFDRPQARNAMTWTMYRQLTEACERIASDSQVRVAILRGAGGKAFIAGTDIAQFRDFAGAEDGVRYERDMERCLATLENLPVPTLAVIEGWAVGGGLAIATVCDLRIATRESRFGVPIARTLGNCLSVANVALLAAAFGVGRTKKMLMLGEMLTAEEANAAGFLAEIVDAQDVDQRVVALSARLAANAPLTMRVSKEAIGRLLHAGIPEGEDLLRICYGSEDFRIGIAAFMDKRPPQWLGR
jgi:enoyl-CoA hydratase/carnithine racemase